MTIKASHYLDYKAVKRFPDPWERRHLPDKNEETFLDFVAIAALLVLMMILSF
jgi:hypothetical protein